MPLNPSIQWRCNFSMVTNIKHYFFVHNKITFFVHGMLFLCYVCFICLFKYRPVKVQMYKNIKPIIDHPFSVFLLSALQIYLQIIQILRILLPRIRPHANFISDFSDALPCLYCEGEDNKSFCR